MVHYTIGQRRGIGVAAAEALYVVALDAANARVVVGPRSSLAVTRLRLRDVNWIGEGEIADLPAHGLPIAARVRSTRPPAPALLRPSGEIEFVQPESGVSSGPGLRVLRFCRSERAGARGRIHRRRLTLEIGETAMAAFDEESPFGEKRKPLLAHEIGQNLDDLSAPELRERIGLLRAEIERLERAIEARQATRAAADSAFKI